MKYLGIKVGNGLGLGNCYFLESQLPKITNEKIEESQIEVELTKVENALEEALTDYKQMIDELHEGDLKELIDFNYSILRSPSLKANIFKKIQEEKQNGPASIHDYFLSKIKALEKADNLYLRERAKDIRDVENKVMRKYYHIKGFHPENLEEDVILVAHEVTPNVLLSKHLNHIKGIVSELGGKTSHVGILTTSLGIPSVFGIQDVLKKLTNGELLFIDGNKGTIENELNPEKIKEIKEKIVTEKRLNQELGQVKEAITTDGKHFEVSANTGDITELDELETICCDGIGLFRTEFIYLNKTQPPTEQELFEVYQLFAKKITPKQMIIRTLDIGGDKKCSYIDIPEEANPFLGYRAIRYCLDHPEFFKTSLKAILRVSADYPVAIMYPMISSIEELEKANSQLEEAKQELKQQGIPFDDQIKVGVMIEIPSLALIAHQVAPKVDFFSIGTNDLVQYTTAVDRGNTVIGKLYNWFHPGVIHLIEQTIKATAPYPDKFTGMCGEMASDPLGIILLVGLGLDEFSVNIHVIKRTKKYISLLNYEETKQFVEKIIQYDSATAIEKALIQYAEAKYGQYYS